VCNEVNTIDNGHMSLNTKHYDNFCLLGCDTAQPGRCLFTALLGTLYFMMLSVLGYGVSNGGMTDELERIWKEEVLA
jgi:hypothetical protein